MIRRGHLERPLERTNFWSARERAIPARSGTRPARAGTGPGPGRDKTRRGARAAGGVHRERGAGEVGVGTREGGGREEGGRREEGEEKREEGGGRREEGREGGGEDGRMMGGCLAEV